MMANRARVAGWLTSFLVSSIVVALLFVGLVDYFRSARTADQCSEPSRVTTSLLKLHSSDLYSLYLVLFENESLNFTRGDIPVLFVTGHADSMRSVTYLARSNYAMRQSNVRFRFFTIDADLTAYAGNYVRRHSQFANECLKLILAYFEHVPIGHRPQHVLLVANSMGGIVAQHLRNEPLDNTLITGASPINRPVLNFDVEMSLFYAEARQPTSKRHDVVIASLYGGFADILVPTYLANLNRFNSSDNLVVSAHTTSMPNVHRQLDHLSMASCTDLLANINSALYELIDERTLQISENRLRRYHVFQSHFQNFKDLTHHDSNGRLFNNVEHEKASLSFELNDFNNELNERIITIDLWQDSSHDDSLFFYTNLNESFACRTLLASNRMVRCENHLNLYEKFGRSIIEGRVKIVNIVDFRLKLTAYSHLLFRVPHWPRNQMMHQLFLKLDSYNKSERIEAVSMPRLFQTKRLNLDSINYYRLNLSSFSSIYQAFYFSLSGSSKNAPCNKIAAFFVDPVSQVQEANRLAHIYRIDPTFKAVLRLSNRIQDNQSAFIELIKLDTRHLLHFNQQSTFNCSNEYIISFRLALDAALGQFVRVNYSFILTFVLFILQLNDFHLILNNVDQKQIEIRLFLFSIHQSQFSLFRHLAFSLLVTTLVILLNMLKFVPNDFRQLERESLFNFMTPFYVYWTAYALLSLASYFVSLLLFFYSSLVKRVCGSTLSDIKPTNKIQLAYFFLAFSSLLINSTLPILMVLASGFTRLALVKSTTHAHFNRLIYILVIFLSSIQNLLILVQRRTLSVVDSALLFSSSSYLTLLFLISHLIYALKLNLRKNIYFSNRFYLLSFILISSLLTLLYGSIRFYLINMLANSYLLVLAFYLPNYNNKPMRRRRRRESVDDNNENDIELNHLSVD